jgi:hypothetical protein
MPSLSIIPSAAVADERLTDLHIRVLCAIGTFSNRLGGNVWASVQTLASQFRYKIIDDLKAVFERQRDSELYKQELQSFQVPSVRVTPNALILSIDFTLAVK